MRQNVNVTLPDTLKSELDRIAIQEGVSKSEVIRNALQDYFYIRNFRELRTKMMAKAQSDGIFTDDDVFKRVS